MTDGGFATLSEIIEAAEAKLSAAVWDFMQGGAGAERTLHENRAAFYRRDFRPRSLAGVSEPDTTIHLLGERWELPVFIAPFAGDGAFHPTGWSGVARAATRLGVPAVVPEHPTIGWDAVAQAISPERVFACQLVPRGPDSTFLERSKLLGLRDISISASRMHRLPGGGSGS